MTMSNLCKAAPKALFSKRGHQWLRNLLGLAFGQCDTSKTSELNVSTKIAKQFRHLDSMLINIRYPSICIADLPAGTGDYDVFVMADTTASETFIQKFHVKL